MQKSHVLERKTDFRITQEYGILYEDCSLVSFCMYTIALFMTGLLLKEINKTQWKHTERMKMLGKYKRESGKRIKIQWTTEPKDCIIQTVLEYNYLICRKIIIQEITKQYSCLVWITPWGIHLDSGIEISEYYIEVMAHTFLIFSPVSANLV